MPVKSLFFRMRLVHWVGIPLLISLAIIFIIPLEQISAADVITVLHAVWESIFRVCSCSQVILTVTGWETGQETVTVLLR